ncbi:zinc finger homeobox protein 3-like [Ptychodera flava]|uniref:zinc finger homeobox protein 3-like n=1 Tax=Ptychodera flava TaxID=63121 RepID=UPI00396A6FE0
METSSGVLSLDIDQSEGMPDPPSLSELVDEFEESSITQQEQPSEPGIKASMISKSPVSALSHENVAENNATSHSKSRKNCNGTPRIPDNPLLDTDGVTCGECMEKFTNLQKYMEHSCSGSLSGTIKQHDDFLYDNNDDENGLSDIENFEGKIVYQPDGSAYLIDNAGDSEEELLPNIPTVKEALGLQYNSNTNQLTVQPPIVNSLHIPCTTALLNMDIPQYGMSLPGSVSAPVMQSYRVYDVRTQKNKTDEDGEKGMDCNDENNLVFENSKPILMCFLCKLSFGFAKSFIGHAVNEHKLVLNDTERKIMSRKNQSAIIQGLGKEKEPLLSFLEPQPPKTQATSGSSYSANGQAFYQQMLSTSQPSVSYIYPVSVAVSTNNSLVTTSTAQLGEQRTPVETNTKKQGHNSSSDACEDNEDTAASGEQQAFSKHISPEDSKDNPAAESDEDAASLDSTAVDNSEGTQSSFKENKAESPLDFLKSSVYNTDKQQNGCTTTEEAHEVSNTNSPTQANKNESASHEEPSRNKAPNDNSTYAIHDSTAEVESESKTAEPSPCNHEHEKHDCERGSPGMYSNYSNDGHRISSSVECPKCDMVLGSSRSLGGHMTMMHSRNSCKTLKCPKCNWHYKYQQTLEAHMKEKHPENETKCVYCQTNQSHPRLARGETYTCGYKPFRCEICNYSTTTKGNLSIHMQSDKHLNNLQELQSGSAAVAAVSAASGRSSDHMFSQTKSSEPTASKPKPKPTWRCDVCEYETNVARNLRIHMTSEKHMHNMLAVQHNMTQMQHDLQMNLGAYQPDDSMYRLMTQNMVPITIATESHLDPHALMGEYPYDQAMYAAAMAGQVTPEMMEMESMGDDQPPINEDPTKNEPLRMFQCSVCNKFVTDDLDLLYEHIHKDRSIPTDSSWKIQIADVIRCNLCNYSTQLKANFQLHCKTDKHIQKLQLVNHIKEGGSQNEWRLKYMNVSNPTQVKCNACDYYTYSVEKLRAHVANYRHETSLKLFRHLQDINITINSETKYYHCTMCNYSSKAKLSLIQHVRSMKHLKIEEDYLKKKAEGNADDESNHGLCSNEGVLDLSSKRERSLPESAADGMKTEKSLKRSAVSSEGTSSSSSSSGMRTTTTQIYTCPYCKYSSIDQDRIRAHVLSQHSVKPQAVLRCPLCQDMCTNKINLEIHLVQVHSVSRDCLQRLMMTVERSDWIGSSSNPPSASPTSLLSPSSSHLPGLDSPTNPTAQSPGTNMFSNKVEDSPDTNQGSDVESGDQYRCQKCHQVFQNLDGLYKHQNEVCPLKEQETPGGPGFLCWKKGCNQYFKTSAALQMHFKEIHAKRPQLPVSERHVYKYRCSQCSLAFKTLEKLQVHSQYHMIRAATKCSICDRSFRSISALRKHTETNHMDAGNPEMAQYLMANTGSGFMGLPTAATSEAAIGIANSMGIPVSVSTSTVFAQPTGAETSMQALTPDGLDEKSQDSMSSDLFSELQEDGGQAMDLSSEQDGDADGALDEGDSTHDGMQPSEETYHDPARKYKCHRCKVGFMKQSELSNHHKTLQHRRGCRAAYTMDKYLDPNRPYKCETCKESFTQKNILLVHYNSVSHLHKLKRSLTETEASPPETSPSNDKKPFKCNICKVAYSQGSTLDIHMRSVLHQTRAAKLESAGAFGGLQHIGQSSDPVSSQSQQQSATTLQHQLLAAAAADASQQLAHVQAQQLSNEAASAAAANAIASAALTQQLMDPTTLALFQQQLLSSSMPSGMHCCSQCNSFFMTQDALTQHQQTQCGLSDAATAAQFASQQKTYMTYTPRPTYPIMRAFLENYGYDLVQQFNENAQGLPPNVDQKDKFKCDKCNREFSSVWVFKAHAEQDHKSFFPTEMIEKFSDMYREEYDKLHAEKNGATSTSTSTSSTPAPPTDSVSTSAQSTAIRSQQSVSSSEQQSASAAAQLSSQLEILQSVAPTVPTCTASVMPPPAIPSPSPQMLIPSALPIQLQPMQTISYIDPTPYMQKSPKRARTRITDDQLKILRAHFDINNSPSEDQICEMSEKSGLPHKVIKHWFRNTLFKERQRNKDSPYNFNNPPSTMLPVSSEIQTSPTVTTTEKKAETETVISENTASPVCSEVIHSGASTTTTSVEATTSTSPEISAIKLSSTETTPVSTFTTNTATMASAISETAFVSSPAASIPISSSTPSNLIPSHGPVTPPMSATSSYSSGTTSKRAGRTRFTDYQIKVLQEFFENNAYPKDDDLEHLSKLLGLSPRVIVVWFQNARQKARKMFENQPPVETEADSGGTRYRRTPGLNYQCNKCLLVFQRFFELIKHQKQHCYKEDDSSNNSYAGSSTPTSPNTPTSMQPETSISIKTEEKKSEASKPELMSTPQVHYQCDKCDLVFPQFEQWNEHQQVHFMQSIRTYMPQHNPFNMMYMPFDTTVNGLTAEQYFGAFQQPKSDHSSNKRKLTETDDIASETQSNTDQDQPRDKRLRTTISPQQLEILYQKYQEDSNPTRRMLDMIARQVGLKKRVVQVWFQNTRARERKGQFRLSAPNHMHKRCPFCRAIFKAKTALEAHIKARHWDQLINGNSLDTLLKQSDTVSFGDFGEGTSASGSPRLYEDFMKTGSILEDSEKALNLSSPPMKGSEKTPLNRSRAEDCIVISDSQDDSSLDIEDGHKDTGSNGDGARDDLESMASSAADTGFSNVDERNVDIEGESTKDGDSNEGDHDTESICHSETTSYTTGGDDTGLSFSDRAGQSMDDAEQRRQARECGKRFRTQMSQVQLKVLKCCFADYRTPTMHECELLGSEIGLPKRVVQVWFQNARAKEKKCKITFNKQFGLIGNNFDGGRDSCKLCGVQYSAKMSIRDHVFTETHIHNVRKYVSGQLEKDASESTSSVSQLLQHADPIEAQRAMAASFLPNHQAALLGHGHMGGLTTSQLQSMQAQAMSAFLGHTPPAETETRKKDETPSIKKENKEAGESSTSSSRTSESSAAMAAAAAAASSQSSFLQDMSSAEAAYMSYFFGGMAPYYTQTPFVYPLYSPEQAATFFPYDPSLQMGLQAHLLQAQHMSPHPAAMAAIAGFNPSVTDSSSKKTSYRSTSDPKPKSTSTSSSSTTTQETRHSRTELKKPRSTPLSGNSSVAQPTEASTSDHSIATDGEAAASKPSTSAQMSSSS